MVGDINKPHCFEVITICLWRHFDLTGGKIFESVLKCFSLRNPGRDMLVLSFKLSEQDNILFAQDSVLSAQDILSVQDNIFFGQLIILFTQDYILSAQDKFLFAQDNFLFGQLIILSAQRFILSAHIITLFLQFNQTAWLADSYLLQSPISVSDYVVQIR